MQNSERGRENDLSGEYTMLDKNITKVKETTLYYTGVGARTTPISILKDMTDIAVYLEKRSIILRSGGAIGADAAFEKGVNNSSLKEIYYANDYNKETMEIASKIHPNWNACSNYAKKLHARNIKQVLGRDLKTPSSFLICWTKDGKDVGGTRTAIVCARNNNIPVFNLYFEESGSNLLKYIDELLDHQ